MISVHFLHVHIGMLHGVLLTGRSTVFFELPSFIDFQPVADRVFWKWLWSFPHQHLCLPLQIRRKSCLSFDLWSSPFWSPQSCSADAYLAPKSICSRCRFSCLRTWLRSSIRVSTSLIHAEQICIYGAQSCSADTLSHYLRPQSRPADITGNTYEWSQ